MTAGQAFPPGFVWGAATSAYQIEGATQEDGRGVSIWDRFAHEPGRVVDGSTGDIACDHYHRWPEDVSIMAGLGLGAYRFSISWPRIFPTGRGDLNPPGLDFYDRLVDGLLQRGIAPIPTLHHWDLPVELEDAGGWRSRDVVARFVDLAAACYERLGDRVGTWLTINEPWCIAFLGHHQGVHAPGHRDLGEAVRVAHHVLLAHGESVRVYRGAGFPGRIGVALNLWPLEPASDDPADVAAARLGDASANRWFLEAILRGRYPTEVVELYERASGRPFDAVQPGDMATIAQPIDLLGVNYYSRSLVRAAPDAELPWAAILPPPERQTAMGWDVVPEALERLLVDLDREYGIPLLVSENGAAYPDDPDREGRVEDPARITYLRDHIAAVRRAIAAGANVEGYLVWSLLDNFEWAEGLTKRFGLVAVDYASQRRTVKASGRFFAEVIAANSLP